MFFWFVVQELCFETGNKKGRQSCKSLPHISSKCFCIWLSSLLCVQMSFDSKHAEELIISGHYSFACALDRRDSSEPAKMEIGWVLLKTFEKSIKVHVAGWIVCKTKTKLICKESYATFHLKKILGPISWLGPICRVGYWKKYFHLYKRHNHSITKAWGGVKTWLYCNVRTCYRK